jgi:hypothetical protein
VFLIGALFIALAAFLSSVANRPERARCSETSRSSMRFDGMVNNMLEDPGC